MHWLVRYLIVFGVIFVFHFSVKLAIAAALDCSQAGVVNIDTAVALSCGAHLFFHFFFVRNKPVANTAIVSREQWPAD